MPAAEKTRTGVEHKTFRKVKAYTAEGDVNPNKRRRLESFATAFFPSSTSGKASTNSDSKDATNSHGDGNHHQFDGNPNTTITGPEFLSDKPSLANSLRAGKVSAITKMTLKVADHIIADVKKSSTSQSSSSCTKFVVPKLADRQLSLAMALVTLAKDRASTGKKKSSSGFYPILIASRHKQDSDDTNSALRGLSYLIHNKLGCGGNSVLVQVPVGGDCPSTSDVPAALSLDPGDIASVDDAHWKRCTHLIILHEGGPDSSRQCLYPSELNPSAQKFVMVSAIQHLTDEFVSAFVGRNVSAAVADNNTAATEEKDEAAAKGDKTVVNAKLLSIEGSVKIQSLWTLLLHNAGSLKKKVVVSCQSRPSAVFHNELFNSLEFTNEGQKFELMCDWESRETNTGFVQQRFTNWDVSQKNRGCVLLSSTCHLQGADLVVQYDTAPLSGYQSVVEKVANGGSEFSAAEAVPTDRSVGRKSGRNSSTKKSAAAAAAVAKKAVPELVIFVFPCEVKALAAALPSACTSENHTLTLERINAPAMARGSLIGEEIKKQVNELYALNMKAFEAYKSFMATYAHLQPGTIFNVRALNVDVVSAQFGLTETPMLDLRLKDTRYRPKENWSRAVMARDRQILKDLRAKGKEIEAEAPEEEEEEQ